MPVAACWAMAAAAAAEAAPVAMASAAAEAAETSNQWIVILVGIAVYYGDPPVFFGGRRNHCPLRTGCDRCTPGYAITHDSSAGGQFVITFPSTSLWSPTDYVFLSRCLLASFSAQPSSSQSDTHIAYLLSLHTLDASMPILTRHDHHHILLVICVAHFDIFFFFYPLASSSSSFFRGAAASAADFILHLFHTPHTHTHCVCTPVHSLYTHTRERAERERAVCAFG